MESPSGEGTRHAPEPVAAAAELRASLKHLRTGIRGRVFATKLVVCALITVTGGVLAAQDALSVRIAGVVLLGCMYAHAAELQHETLHNLAFRSRRANTVAGTVLGMPMLISFAAYRTSHLRHHRYLGTPLNREFFDYGDQYGAGQRSRTAAALDWVTRFTMFHHYGLFLASTVRALRGQDFAGETATVSRRIRRDHLLMLAAVLALTALSLALGSTLVLWVWVLPLVLVAAPVHALVELPEHHRCETLNEDPFRNTRTIRSNRLMTWFTNGNNYHVEHHVMPNLPIERLPDLHAEIRDRLHFYHPGYVDYFRKLVAK
ncbi:fatty acid desaturase [Streptomyces mashuensis]|uniref:Fatty acid desaturase n=1 Tax=Streptomyces mashuensis TaxID=33904 RepID=A0A919B514_9ACTN|nr:fatty acid desaturase [Streptomyces mashuensis]GHF52410.1 fatty acid desaturase [Streptomyces mashuensis]